MLYTFVPASNALSASNAIGPVGMVILIVMNSYIDFQVAVRSFELITDIPERVSRWFGQGGDRLGDEQHASKVTGAFVGSMENRTTSPGTGLANKQRLDNSGRGNMPKEKKTPLAPGRPPEVPPPPGGTD